METLQSKPTNTEQHKTHTTRWVVLVIAVILLVAVVGGGIWQRMQAEVTLNRATEEAAVATVDVVSPTVDTSADEIVLPGNAQAFIDTPIYARTSGYLKSWNFDIGAHVRKGDLLAEIEAPELDKQLMQARANLSTAQSNFNLATITANRDQRLLKTNSISTQETDNAMAQAAATKTIAEASAAEVARLEQLKVYQRIYAPYDGVITARNTDVGAVIDSGAGSARELFHISAINKLRVFVSVPQVWSRYAKPGTKATLNLTEFPDREFPCTLVRSSGAIETSTRTLLTEFDVENSTGELLPGSYVQVHFKLPAGSTALTVPANTLLFREEGLRVGVVKNGKTQLLPIKVGRDFGTKVEVIAGLQPTDAVIVDPSDSLIDGLTVKVRAKQGQRKQ